MCPRLYALSFVVCARSWHSADLFPKSRTRCIEGAGHRHYFISVEEIKPKIKQDITMAQLLTIKNFLHDINTRKKNRFFRSVLVLCSRSQLKCDGTRAETRFRLSAKRTSAFKLAGASVKSNTGSRVVRKSGSNAGYTTFRGSVKGTGYPLHSPVSPSLPLPCVNVAHHISTGVYQGTGILCTRKCECFT